MQSDSRTLLRAKAWGIRQNVDRDGLRFVGGWDNDVSNFLGGFQSDYGDRLRCGLGAKGYTAHPTEISHALCAGARRRIVSDKVFCRTQNSQLIQ